MHNDFKKCNYVTMGQWLATTAKSGCSGGGVKVFQKVEECNFLMVDTKLNNPDAGGGMFVGMKKTNVTAIDPEFVVHADFFSGEESNVAAVGGKWENCDVIHFHIKDSTACCVNTEITGSPGTGSMLEEGVSDNSSFVMAGGKLEVEDNAAPVFAAKDCSMRFYDCELVKQKGTTDLFANKENCITRLFACEEIRSIHERVFNEKNKCRVDLVGNVKVKADDSDIAVMTDNCALLVKYNDKFEAKQKVFHIKDNSALFTERNGPLEADEGEALTIEDTCNVSLNQDETLVSKQNKYAVTMKKDSILKSRKSLLEGKDSQYCLKITEGSEMLSEYDTIKSKHHAIQMADSKMDMRFPDVDVDHDGYHAGTSFIDVMEGRIKTKGEEFVLSECEGTIKHVNLEGEKTIQLEGKNSFYTFNQTTRYIKMASKDKLECEKMTNLIDITGTDCIFKVREGTCEGDISINSKRTETWLHNLSVNGSTTIDANLCKLFGCSFKALSVKGSQLQTGGNSALGTTYESDLGLLSDDTYQSLSCTGNYIMNNIGGSSISVKGLAFYLKCPDTLSEPYKKGVYSSDDLDLYAEDNIKMWANSGKIEIEAATDILSEAGMNIEEKAGMSIKEEASMSIESKAGMNIKEEAGGMIDEKAGGMAKTIASRVIHNG
jgi:hypothetical protein